MIAARLTRIAVIGIIALLLVAATDSLRSSEPESASSGLGAAASTPAETGALAVCGPEQLVLELDRLGTDPALVLRNVTGTTCRQRRLPITLTLLDREGHLAEATASVQQFFVPTTYSPNVDVLVGFAVLYKCGEPKPAIFRAGAGSYHAGGRLPRTDAECLNNVGP